MQKNLILIEFHVYKSKKGDVSNDSCNNKY